MKTLPDLDPLTMTILQDVDEMVTKVVDLSQAAADQEVVLGLLEGARYVVINSDVCLGIKINGSGESMIEATRLILADAAIYSLHLTNRGLIYDQGIATGGAAAAMTDTEKSWGYTSVTGTEINTPMDIEEVQFKIDVNGQIGVIELTDAEDVAGATLATTLQTLLDDDLGASEVTVAWVADTDDTGHLTIVNDRVGANAITITPIELDNASLVTLGLFQSTQELGDETLVGMELGIIAGTGVGEEETITSFTPTIITVDQAWGVAPVANSEYRIYKPQAGEVEIILAR